MKKGFPEHLSIPRGAKASHNRRRDDRDSSPALVGSAICDVPVAGQHSGYHDGSDRKENDIHHRGFHRDSKGQSAVVVVWTIHLALTPQLIESRAQPREAAGGDRQ